MMTFDDALQEALQEAASGKEKVFLVQFGSNVIDDETFAKWKEALLERDEFKIVSVERHLNEKNVARVVATKASQQALQRLWMVERVWKE